MKTAYSGLHSGYRREKGVEKPHIVVQGEIIKSESRRVVVDVPPHQGTISDVDFDEDGTVEWGEVGV